MKNVNIPEIHGERTVLTIDCDAYNHFGSLLPKSLNPNDDPPLKLIHATQRIIVPNTTEFGLEAAKLLSSRVN